MYIFNDFDEWQQALHQIDMNESALPIYNGHLLIENADVYAKIQKLLNCRSMESSHKWLYSLDVESLDESEIYKVNNLYKLACERGAIETEPEVKDETTKECDIIQAPAPEVPAVNPQPVQTVPMSAFTILYSAVRSDGQIKTGEAYSNAINTRSAKADVISKLEKAGYHGITILAIEAGDPDAAGCDATCPGSCCTADDSSDMCVLNDMNEADDKDDADSDADESSDDKSDDKEDDSSDDKDDAKSDDEAKKEEDAEEPDEKLKDDKDQDSDDAEDSKDSDDEEDSEDDDKDEELSDDKKAQLKDSYKKAFKAALVKCKFFEKSFSDLTLDEKVQFFTKLSDAWKNKADPTKFMTDKEIDQLESIVVKK